MRRLLLLASAIVLVDTMFYAAITPLLPRYSDDLGLSKAEAGVLTAAYPAGTLLGSLPSAWLAVRVGAKRTALVGRVSLSASSLVFGLGESVAVLVAARFVQGLGGASSWTGALAWLVAVGPRERRGELIGTAFGAAVGGALLGPVLGGLADAASPETAFGVVAAVALGLLAATAATPPPPPTPVHAAPPPGGFRVALRQPAVLAGGALIVLVGLFFGVMEVLVPLRLDELGSGTVVVAGTFLVAAGLQALASPLAGRRLDRTGPLPLVRVALAAAVALALLLPAFAAPGPVVVLAVIAGPLVGMLWVPGMTVLSDATADAGLDQAFAFALVNLTWAGAQTAGSGGGGALADSAGDWAAYGAVAAVMAVALTASVRLSARSP